MLQYLDETMIRTYDFHERIVAEGGEVEARDEGMKKSLRSSMRLAYGMDQKKGSLHLSVKRT